MTRLLEPPRERDLPPALRARLRGQVLEAIEGPAPRHRKAWRLAIGPVAVAAAVLVVASPALVDRHGNGDHPDVVAFGAGAVSPGLRRVIADCERSAYGRHVGLAPGSLKLVNRGETSRYHLAVFLAPDGRMVVCNGGRDGGGGNYGPYEQAHWLPGPISVEGASSTDWGGGDVTVAGRVSRRVARVEVEHADGRKTIARLSDGTFAVATDGANLEPTVAALVTYDRSGAVIDRRIPVRIGTPEGSCYTDPSGAVILGTQRPDCRPAEPWP